MLTRDKSELAAAAYDAFSSLLTDDEMAVTRVADDPSADAQWRVGTRTCACRLSVVFFRRFTPRDVDRVFSIARSGIDDPVLVVAPWLSARSRDLLAGQGFNYLDLTGNVRLRVRRPSINFRLEGAGRDPDPPVTAPVRLQGAGVNALVRLLVDVEPPYRMVDLARASGLSNAYVSRTLDALEDERLIDRDPRTKAVTAVDWANLLRARSEHYSLLGSNRSATYIARTGLSTLCRSLGTDSLITGSFAAFEYVQEAAPSQLALYVDDFTAFAERYGLLPAQQGPNVVLLKAADKSQLRNIGATASGAPIVAISQVALDCLRGNGRMPQEGEALIDWMMQKQQSWRQQSLADFK